MSQKSGLPHSPLCPERDPFTCHSEVISNHTLHGDRHERRSCAGARWCATGSGRMGDWYTMYEADHPLRVDAFRNHKCQEAVFQTWWVVFFCETCISLQSYFHVRSTKYPMAKVCTSPSRLSHLASSLGRNMFPP